MKQIGEFLKSNFGVFQTAFLLLFAIFGALAILISLGSIVFTEIVGAAKVLWPLTGALLLTSTLFGFMGWNKLASAIRIVNVVGCFIGLALIVASLLIALL